MRRPMMRQALALGLAATLAAGLATAVPAGAEEPATAPAAAPTTVPPTTAPPTTTPPLGTADVPAAAAPPTSAPAPPAEAGAPEGDPGFSFPAACFPTFSLCVRTLTISVNAQPDTGSSFGFTVTQDGTGAQATTRVVEGTPQDVRVPRLASYKVRLTGLTDRYEIRSVRCQGTAQSVSGNVVSIGLGNNLTDPFRPDNGDIDCTFTVRRPGSIQIRQTSSPSADEDFTYNGTGPNFSTRFVLDNDSLGSDRNQAPSSQTFDGLGVGDYTFSITPRAGFRLTDLTCDNGESPNLAAGRVAIALSQGEDVVCRFRLTELATVRVTLDVRPDDPADAVFDLQSLGGGTVTLDDDGVVGNGQRSNTVRLTNLLPGDYAVRQATDLSGSGIDLTAITCAQPVDITSFATRQVQFELDAGEDQVCTFRNDRRGSITITQNALPDGPRDYTYTDSGAATGFTLDDDADPTLPNSITISDIRAGTTRTFTQGLPGGSPPWQLVAETCDSAVGTQLNTLSRSLTITVSPGAHVTCTFFNAQFLPDALVSTARSGPFSGDEVRSDSILAEQTVEESVSADGRTTTMVVKVQNDTPLTDDLVITGFESGNGGFATTYRSGGVDITDQVLSPEGFRFEDLGVGGERLIAIDFTSLTGSVPGTARKVDLGVRSGTAPDAVDVVRVRARRV